MTPERTRKRAPGGGRKPLGASKKTKTFATRIKPEIFTALKREADRSERSLSQEVEIRLRESLELPAKLQKDWGAEHVEALARLVSQIVRTVETAVGANSNFDEAGNLVWNKSPYTHAAVTTAIGRAMAHFTPAGEIETPRHIMGSADWMKRENYSPEDIKRLQTPQAIGLACVLPLLDQRMWSSPPPIPKPGAPVVRRGGKMHSMPRIHKILGKKEPKK